MGVPVYWGSAYFFLYNEELEEIEEVFRLLERKEARHPFGIIFRFNFKKSYLIHDIIWIL